MLLSRISLNSILMLYGHPGLFSWNATIALSHNPQHPSQLERELPAVLIADHDTVHQLPQIARVLLVSMRQGHQYTQAAPIQRDNTRIALLDIVPRPRF